MKLTHLPEWRNLQKHYEEVRERTIKDLFAGDPARASAFTLEELGLYVDYSKHRICKKTMGLLMDLARASHLAGATKAMFAGEKINRTENRPVLHVALRNLSPDPVYVDGQDVMPQVRGVLQQMGAFAQRVRTGEWRGYTKKPIKNIVNIGIGGSDLGPVMVYEALKPYTQRDLHFSFVSNIDGSHIAEALRDKDPAETLFIVASKTFTTLETMTNAESAKRWLLDSLKDERAVASHFVGLGRRAILRLFGHRPFRNDRRRTGPISRIPGGTP